MPETIFIVDDDEAIRDSLAILLDAHGFATRAFASGQEFLDAYDGESGCALIDVTMPGMSGLELQAKLAERRIALPVIVITGNADVPIAVQAMKNGALDFIEKPCSEESLLAAIRQALATQARTRQARTASAEARQRIDQLTTREREVLDQLVLGHPNKVIAYHLSISPRTVEIHRARIMHKMQVRSLSELVRLAIDAHTDTDARP